MYGYFFVNPSTSGRTAWFTMSVVYQRSCPSWRAPASSAAWRSGPLRLDTWATDCCPWVPPALVPLDPLAAPPAPPLAGPAPPPAHALSSSPAASTAPSAPTHPARHPCRMRPSLSSTPTAAPSCPLSPWERVRVRAPPVPSPPGRGLG